MIEFEFTNDSGRRTYRHEVSEEDGLRLVIDGKRRQVVNLSESGIAYKGEDDARGLTPAKIAFDLNGRPVIFACNLKRVRSAGGVQCCLITALAERDKILLSKFLMECQKRSIRRARGELNG